MTPSLAQGARKRLGRVRRLVESLSLRELLEVIRVNVESEAGLRARVHAAVSHSDARLVFICHGNIMRSAFAANYARSLHPKLRSAVVSAGTHASRGSPADGDAITVASQFGVDLSQHSSTPLSALELSPADLLICMDMSNVAIARAMRHVRGDQVFLVGDVFRAAGAGAPSAAQSTEIPRRVISDPYGMGAEATRRAFTRVAHATDAWARLIGRM